MPNVSSPLGTSNSAVPLVRADALGQAAGFSIMFADITALNVAVTAEKANITGGAGIWTSGQILSVASEAAQGVYRTWDASAQHSRKVWLSSGNFVTLAADTNAVLFASGVPSSGTGANGDISVDWTARSYSTKASEAWTLTGVVGPLVAAQLTALDLPAINTPLSTALGTKAPIASPTFTGTVSGVTKAHVGLANADNTADASKPVSTAQQTALDLKRNLSAAVNLASEVTGTLTVSNGGHGGASLTAYAPVFGGTTSTGAVQSGTVGTSGQVLTSNGVGALPTFQAAAGGTVTSVGLNPPAAGITVSGGPVTTTGSITLALANDLSAVEGLATTGIVRRTGTDTWSAGTAVGLTTEVTGTLPIANGGTSTGTATGSGSLVLATGPSVTNLMTDRLIASAGGAASTPPVLVSGAVFTGGTATTTKPQHLVEPAGATSTGWSTAGTMTGVNAPSGFTGNLLDLQTNGVAYFQVSASGGLGMRSSIGFWTSTIGASTQTVAIIPGSSSVQVSSTGAFSFGSGTNAGSTQDVFLSRAAAAAALQLGAANANSPVAQTLQAQGSRSGTDSNVGGANFTIQAGTGTGIGPPSSLSLKSAVAVASGTGAQTQTTGLTIYKGLAILPNTTVGALPAAASDLKGAHTTVTDALAPSWNSALTGGGAVYCGARCNGTAWVAF